MKTQIKSLASITLLALSTSVASATIITVFAAEDTFVRSDSPNDAFGTDSTLLVGGHASVGPFNTFLRFNLDDPALVGAPIESVVLRLTSINQAGAGTIDINLYQLSAANSNWQEGVSGTVPTGTSDTGATFNNKAGQGDFAVSWASGNTNANFVAGTDYVDAVLGNYSGAANTGDGGEHFDFGNTALASLTQSLLGEELNLILMDQTGDTNFLRIASRQNGSFDAPQLMITIPEPTTYAAIFGLAALGLLIRRRFRRR